MNALRCVIGYSHKMFGAVYIDKEDQSIDKLIDKIISKEISEDKITSRRIVDFKEIQEILGRCIYSKLSKLGVKHIDNIDWNLIEYYGLISTAEDENGSWNRLVGQKSILLEYNDSNGKATMFLIEHANFIVLTYLK